MKKFIILAMCLILSSAIFVGSVLRWPGSATIYLDNEGNIDQQQEIVQTQARRVDLVIEQKIIIDGISLLRSTLENMNIELEIASHENKAGYRILLKEQAVQTAKNALDAVSHAMYQNNENYLAYPVAEDDSLAGFCVALGECCDPLSYCCDKGICDYVCCRNQQEAKLDISIHLTRTRLESEILTLIVMVDPVSSVTSTAAMERPVLLGQEANFNNNAR